MPMRRRFLGDERVETLEVFMAAYAQGREDVGGVGMYEEDAALLAGFDTCIAERTRYNLNHGSARWPSLIRRLGRRANHSTTCSLGRLRRGR